MRAEVTKAVALLQSRETGSVDQALQFLQKTVFSFSMNVCGHREDAEDTAQEVLLKAIPYLPKFDSPKALTTWLYTVAKNRCLMSRRKSKFAPREHLSLEGLMPDPAELDHLGAIAAATPSPEKAAMTSETQERVKAVIRQLPPAYRLVLVLHDMEELSSDEIARIAHLREGTVRVRLHRARLFVRRELAKAAVADRPTPRTRAKASRRPVRSATVHPARPAHCKEMFAALSDYLDGTLDPSLCEQLEKHIDGCEPCEAFLVNLRTTVEAIKRVEPAVPDAAAIARLRSQTKQLVKALAAAR